MIKLDYNNYTGTAISSLLFKELLLCAQAVLYSEKIIHRAQALRIELSLVENQTIQILNRRFHKKNRHTDIISLSYFEKNMQDDFAGEIFISVPFARAQAKRIGQSLTEEMRFLFVHGLLHVFGYDHKKPAEEKKMLKVAYKILGRLVRQYPKNKI